MVGKTTGAGGASASSAGVVKQSRVDGGVALGVGTGCWFVVDVLAFLAFWEG